MCCKFLTVYLNDKNKIRENKQNIHKLNIYTALSKFIHTTYLSISNQNLQDINVLVLLIIKEENIVFKKMFIN